MQKVPFREHGYGLTGELNGPGGMDWEKPDLSVLWEQMKRGPRRINRKPDER